MRAPYSRSFNSENERKIFSESIVIIFLLFKYAKVVSNSDELLFNIELIIFSLVVNSSGLYSFYILVNKPLFSVFAMYLSNSKQSESYLNIIE